MLSELQRDRIDIVLVRPRNPLNIGAAARAMANFGFDHLKVVDPYAPNWREARSAVGAPNLLRDAKEFETLAAAVAECTLVAGTGTLEHRKPEQQVAALPGFGPLAYDVLTHDGRLALVFGPEKHGLTRDDLSQCHLLVEIPTHPSQPSMNLGQAVAVCLYELASSDPASQSGPDPEMESTSIPAVQTSSLLAAHNTTSGELDVLAGLIEETMTASGYSPAAMRSANRLQTRELLRRLTLTQPDANRALRFFRRILWRLNHR